ncbi:hypothetical protein [Streptomyces muensis]|uniref:Peptidase inhibitor family I36 n=1 Tax=Streptomyces muensis TaxID=1077944 RepID=A0A9X1TRK5_STRM4|nr:hypothetical protein [Streptomyces muensis]MCF1600340.1 hypothetical protein [Streptomyces muensis]
MRKLRMALAGGTAAVALGAGLLVGAGPAAAGGAGADGVRAAATVHGCPSGAVCIYPGPSWNNDKPSHTYWSRGVHKLYDQYDKHRVFNNQTDGWTVQMCKGGNGTGCGDKMGPGWYIDQNLTPINSIYIKP